MSNSKVNFESFSANLDRNKVLSDASEIQGILCGMMAGGMKLNDQSWLVTLADCICQGEALPEEVEQEAKLLFEQSCQQLVEADFALVLCLPEDDAPINERGAALIRWVQGFMLGFGLYQDDLSKCSAEVKEALEDFAEIARMDEHMEEDEDSEQALFEVMEYVRVSSMLCFNDFGQQITNPTPGSNTLH